MSTTALAPWFGSNRTLAPHVGAQLAGCDWVLVGFAGGMSEVSHITARTVVVNDLHRGIINLARVAAEPRLGPRLIRELRRTLFHPDTLYDAQRRLIDRGSGRTPTAPEFDYARDYFVSAWMARNGTAGTDRELQAGLSVRYDAGGGDSVVRFRSATAALLDFRRAAARCSFVASDVFGQLDKVKDKPKHGIYLDPPFPGPGDKYRHRFAEADQRRLAARVAEFTAARVVMRFYRHPLIEELYPAGQGWGWLDLAGGRKQSNAENPPEVLLVRNAAPPAATPPLARPSTPERFANL